MVQRVTELLHRTAPNERAAVVYLLQAQLRPAHEGLEIGLGEKLLVQAVTAAYATAEREIPDKYRQQRPNVQPIGSTPRHRGGALAVHSQRLREHARREPGRGERTTG